MSIILDQDRLINELDDIVKFAYYYQQALKQYSETCAVLVVDPDCKMQITGGGRQLLEKDYVFRDFDLSIYEDGDGETSLLKSVASSWEIFDGITFDNIDVLDNFHSEDAETVKYWLLQMLRWDYVSGNVPFKHYIEFKDKPILMRCSHIPEFVKEQSLQTIFITREFIECAYKNESSSE